MEKYCLKHNIEYRKIPMFHSLQASFPAFLYSILKTLNSIMPVKKDDISESLNEMKKSQKLLSSSNLTENNPSLNIAEWLTNIPVIYYP